ncbi:MAG: alpha/beta hydrolase [Halobacteriales archaeon]|nr:alpha/beta hydrolase [Halobacteriales archaeon]
MSAAEEPQADIREMLNEMDALPAPSSSKLSPEGARQFTKQRFPLPDEPEPVGDVMDLLVPGPDEQVPVRVYVPDRDPPYPGLVYLHGGGWVTRDVDMYDPTCRAFVRESGCLVVAVEYRRAPEHPFPAALKDCYAAAEWTVVNAESFNMHPDAIAIGGDSAGGNLAAAITQLARERDGPTFAHQMLIYPVTDYAFDTDSYRENADGYLLTKESMEWFWDHYLADDIHGANPYASPLRASDLSGLPSATIVTCGFDPLRDEGVAYVERLQAAGVDVTHIHYEAAIHDVMTLRDPDITNAKQRIEAVSQQLRTRLQ